MLKLTGADAFDSDGLGALMVWRRHFFARVESGVEECVDQSGLAQTRLANNHGCEAKPFANTFSMKLIRKVGETNVASKLLSGSRSSRDGGRASSGDRGSSVHLK